MQRHHGHIARRVAIMTMPGWRNKSGCGSASSPCSFASTGRRPDDAPGNSRGAGPMRVLCEPAADSRLGKSVHWRHVHGCRAALRPPAGDYRIPDDVVAAARGKSVDAASSVRYFCIDNMVAARKGEPARCVAVGRRCTRRLLHAWGWLPHGAARPGLPPPSIRQAAA